MTLYDDGSPERLWHYTSGSGAKGIFESRTLWAGHLGYMNDTSEVGHAMSISREVVARLKQELPELCRYLGDHSERCVCPLLLRAGTRDPVDVIRH